MGLIGLRMIQGLGSSLGLRSRVFRVWCIGFRISGFYGFGGEVLGSHR